MYQYVLCAKQLIPQLVKKNHSWKIHYGNINNLILFIIVFIHFPFDLTKGYLFSINGFTLILKIMSVGLQIYYYVTDKNENVSSEDLDINYYISSFGPAAIMSVSAFITAVILNLSLILTWPPSFALLTSERVIQLV